MQFFIIVLLILDAVEQKPRQILFIEYVEVIELQANVPVVYAVDAWFCRSLVQYQGRVGLMLVDLFELAVMRKEN